MYICTNINTHVDMSECICIRLKDLKHRHIYVLMFLFNLYGHGYFHVARMNSYTLIELDRL